ncbi:MAG: MmcQ/YjbR family DNA-binding protein [Deltaproteobacteria bacterium]|jgi:predicted DNA-binding protein (MmcQ/YjbR family)|nr:MmcQ/YjbR family DNA-binding protein [Deltaproteobacteria bacterium]
MNYPWLDEYCTAKVGAIKEWKAEWGAFRFMVGGKMFVLKGTYQTGRPIVTLKLAPADGDLLRNKYKDVIPGYYMNKVHWNSVYLDGQVPDKIVKEMIDQSYALIFTSLTKKAQKEIMSQHG